MRAVLLLCLLLAGCASVNDALTPSLRETRDDFYGTAVLVQPPVSAAKGLADGWNLLGFDWNARTPDTVFLTVGTTGIRAITDAGLNIDGVVIERLELASKATEWDAGRSFRRFAVPLATFEAMARAHTVRLRVGGLNDAVVSTFGASAPDAVVMQKLPPFLARVQALRGG